MVVAFLNKWLLWIPMALCPGAPAIFERTRWTHQDEATDFFGAMESINNLFSTYKSLATAEWVANYVGFKGNTPRLLLSFGALKYTWSPCSSF